MSETRTIRPARRLVGEAKVGGDKSISHRAVLLAGFAQGTTRIVNLSTSLDVASSLRCLRALGVAMEQTSATELVIRGRAGRFAPPARTLDCGNSGTTMRLLSGLLAGQPFTSRLDGDDSLRRRPMRRILVPLERMGATVGARDGNFPPIVITGTRPLRPITHRPEVASAQVKSCVLLAGLQADGQTTVSEVRQTRDHTERMLPIFGISIRKESLSVCVQGPSVPLSPGLLQVPGDPSSAAFLWAAAAALPGSQVTVRDVGINPTRAVILDVLRSMRVDVRVENVRLWGGEPVADVTVRGDGRLQAIDIGESLVPLLIDELPILGVLCAVGSGSARLSGAAELRTKESDRIRSVVTNLRRMGAKIEETPDGWIIEGGHALQGAELDSFGDHRIAMAMTVAALLASGESTIRGAECVAVSFPDFFEQIEALRA
ncbi:MAG: 3-phosphoshikimate 1-carboxyvinyltransferase [candidate division KSB1 bacterium]|nr:3-phosphoshikimate 1-carboxyvinyltransferase [candidate division KSB1 bacterium]